MNEQIEDIRGNDEHLDSEEISQEDFEIEETDENAGIH